MSAAPRPLAAGFISFVAGILFALRFSPPPVSLLAAAGTVLIISGLLLRAGRRAARRPVLDALLFASLALAGAANGAAARLQLERDCRAWLPDGAPIALDGALAGSVVAPQRQGTGSAPLLPLAASEIRTAQATVPGCGGEVRIRIAQPSGPVLAGTELHVEGRWVRFADPVVRSAWPRNPLHLGFVAADRVVETAPPRLGRHPLLTLRGRTERHLHRLFPNHWPLAEALVLGRREWMDPAIRDRFANAGLAHLLAISGMHVGLIAGALLLLGRSLGALRLPRRAVPWVVIACIAAYLAMIGAPASAVRAGVMIALALAALLLQRPAASLPIIAAAGFVILAHRPAALLDPGFQMSFGGVLGILAVRAVALRQLPARWRHNKPLRAVFELAVVSAAAFLATAPITAYHFGTVAPVAILANLPAIPLMSLGLVGIGAAAVVEPLVPPLGRLLAEGAGVALDVLDAVAAAAADLPYGHATAAKPQGWAWAAGALVVLLAADAARRLRAPVRWAVVASAATAFLLVWPVASDAARDSALEIHFLDVGQGDAVAIRTPAGRWLLVDAGPRTDRFDAGERRVLPFLRAHNVGRLEALILTHPDADHIGGAPSVLRGIEVARLVDPGLPAGKPLYLETLRVARERGIPWTAARAGRTLRVDGVALELLWPEAETLDDPEEANEISVVLHLRYSGFSALLTGDASAGIERRLAERYGAGLRSEILKAGHHGSRTSTSAELLDAVRPELVVISSGKRNRYGHPAPEVLRRLGERGVAVARTDRDGTISIRVDAGTPPSWRRGVP